ncbi:MAG: urease accessory protein UreH domain-containing protein [Gammaproteobacteria bacterium]
MKLRRYHLSIDGMRCGDCENTIEEAVFALPGVINAKASFTDEILELELDEDVVTLITVCASVQAAGYRCRRQTAKKTKGIVKRFALVVFAIAGIILLLQLDRLIKLDLSFEDINVNTSYGLLFLVGFLTSFHCIGMCGGFVLSYAAEGASSGKSTYLNHVLYSVGKIISYSTMGALFGLIGGAITITTGMRSLAMALAALFLCVYGLSLLDAFAVLRRFHLRLPRYFMRKLSEKRRQMTNPLTIGLLNGLMVACGPLQAMYIMAAGTASPFQGAAILSVFALGTLPIMFLFGVFSTLISANASQHFLKISGFILMFLGAVMFNRSMAISGTGYDINSLLTTASQSITAVMKDWGESRPKEPYYIQEGYQVIYTEVESREYIPGKYLLRNKIPVKWVINVRELSPCNQQIIVPDLKLTIDLKMGLQMVEFVPTREGTIGWSCAMGMMTGTFIVKD